MQPLRKRVNEFVNKCSRRPQPRLPEGRQEQSCVKDRRIDQPTFIKGFITNPAQK